MRNLVTIARGECPFESADLHQLSPGDGAPDGAGEQAAVSGEHVSVRAVQIGEDEAEI